MERGQASNPSLKQLLVSLNRLFTVPATIEPTTSKTYQKGVRDSLDCFERLLSDAEITEDVIQDVLRVNLPRDAAEVVQRLAHITCHQVAGDAVLQT